MLAREWDDRVGDRILVVQIGHADAESRAGPAGPQPERRLAGPSVDRNVLWRGAERPGDELRRNAHSLVLGRTSRGARQQGAGPRRVDANADGRQDLQ